jgi:hypothetical protein
MLLTPYISEIVSIICIRAIEICCYPLSAVSLQQLKLKVFRDVNVECSVVRALLKKYVNVE